MQNIPACESRSECSPTKPLYSRFWAFLSADFVLDPRHSNAVPKITVSRTRFAPDGTVRMVPEAEVRDACEAGGADAIQVKDAKGAVRYVKPHN